MASIVRKIINTASAPKPIGPYSQAVQVDNTLYISGQIGLDVNTMKLAHGGAKGEARKALENIGEILKAAGVGYDNVVKCTVLLTNMDDFLTVNKVYTEFFKSNFPARAAYQVAKLPAEAAVEIEAVAVVGQITDA